MDSSPHGDPELAAEQDHLDYSHDSLRAMRERAEALLKDLRGAGLPPADRTHGYAA